MLISVHIPQCAGITFNHLLEEHFGARLLLDYADRPLAADYRWRMWKQRWLPFRDPRPRLGQIDCVHGHFTADKYDFLDASSRHITWLRDPLQRVAGHYHSWKRLPDLRNRDCRQLVAQNLSLEDFAALPRMRNVMTRFLAGKQPHHFFFMGLVEDLPQSLARFTRLTGIATDTTLALNRNDEGEEGYEITEGVRARIENLNRHDREIYETTRKLVGSVNA